MKHFVKILCLALVLCVSLGFAACKKDADAQNPVTNTLPTDTATIYYLSGCSYGETVYTTDQLLISDPAQTYIYFDVDGYGILSIDSFETYFQYADGQLWDEIDPDTKVNYSIQGDALTLEQEGYKMVFTRGELPEWAQPQEEETGEEYTEELPAEDLENVN